MTIKAFEKLSPVHSYYQVANQLQNYVYALSREAYRKGEEARAAVRTPADLAARQDFIRRTVADSLGGLPPVDTPLNTAVTGSVREDGFLIEKLVYESRPKCYVTANLYRPDAVGAPAPAVLFVCGHHEKAKHEPEYQTVCRALARCGFIVLAVDPIGQGERVSYCHPATGVQQIRWGTQEHDYAGAQCLAIGHGLGRYFLHDAMRSIDVLLELPDVDPNRIGITGNSGGGTQSSLMMLCDRRLAAAAPATFILEREDYQNSGTAQDAEQVWPGFSSHGLDHQDILLSMAPKPVMVLAVDYDFFPIEGTRKVVSEVQRFWRMCGAEGPELFSDASLHRYTHAMVANVCRFFAKALQNRDIDLARTLAGIRSDVTLDPPLLWCLPSGQVRTHSPGARFVQEENADNCERLLSQGLKNPAHQRREAACEWVREQVMRNREPHPHNPRVFQPVAFQDALVTGLFWWSQRGMINSGYMTRPIDAGEGALPTTIAVWKGGTTAMSAHYSYLMEETRAGRQVLVLDVSGSGALKPNPIIPNIDPEEYLGVIQKLDDDLIFIGDSLPALRAYDVLSASSMVRELAGSDGSVRLACFGREGSYGVLAAMIDSTLRVQDHMEGISYKSVAADRYYDVVDIRSFVLPGALRYFDLPEALSWVKRDH